MAGVGYVLEKLTCAPPPPSSTVSTGFHFINHHLNHTLSILMSSTIPFLPLCQEDRELGLPLCPRAKGEHVWPPRLVPRPHSGSLRVEQR